MDDSNVFERLVADEMQRRAGPDPVVDDAAIFTAITTTRSPKWRLQSMFSATKFAVAGAIVALFGGFLLAGVLTQPSDDRVPAAASATSSHPPATEQPSAPPSGRQVGVDVGGWHFQAPTGWVLNRGIGSWTLEKGPIVDSDTYWERPSATITFRSTPDGTFSDPCVLFTKADPFDREVRDIDLGPDRRREQRAELAAAIAAVPGVEVIEAPSETALGGQAFEATRVTVTIPESVCEGRMTRSSVPPRNAYRLWYHWDEGFGWHPRGLGDTITVWIIDNYHISRRLWIDAETTREASPELVEEIGRIVDSVQHPG